MAEDRQHNQYHDTVGVLAIDSQGKLAGACSSSGLPFKVPGRVGDSPIIGHGLYVDPRRGAAVATGKGELIMGVCGSFLAVELMGRGASPLDAACEVLQRILDNYAHPRRSGGHHHAQSVGPVEFRVIAAGLSHGGAYIRAQRIGQPRADNGTVERVGLHISHGSVIFSLQWGRHSCLPGEPHIRQTRMSAPLHILLLSFSVERHPSRFR